MLAARLPDHRAPLRPVRAPRRGLCFAWYLASRTRDLTRSTEARYYAPVPTVVMRPVLLEVADVVEQIFRIACTADLRDITLEDYDAAACDYQADHGLTYCGMCARRCASTAP